jgi:hypothetical protein
MQTAPVEQYEFINTTNVADLSHQQLVRLLASYKRLAQVEWSMKQEAMAANW